MAFSKSRRARFLSTNTGTVQVSARMSANLLQHISKTHVTPPEGRRGGVRERSQRPTLAPARSAGESLVLSVPEILRGVHPERMRDSSLRSE